MSALGPDWVIDEDGYPHREAARIVLFDAAGRLLMARGHDAAQPSRSWWFTIGGGLEPGEDPRLGAVRELYEETGLSVAPSALIGPVMYRSAEFDFLAVTARQDEWFFVAHVGDHAPGLEGTGWTELEKSVIDEQCWWDLDALEQVAAVSEVYPRGLVELARKWYAGWDGVMERAVESSL